MIPAEELRDAATKLREVADDLGQWRYDERIGWLRDRNGDLVAEVSESDAAWMVLMGPDKAEVLATLLDVCAYTQTMHAGCSGLASAMNPEQESALVFARAILRGTQK